LLGLGLGEVRVFGVFNIVKFAFIKLVSTFSARVVSSMFFTKESAAVLARVDFVLTAKITGHSKQFKNRNCFYAFS